MVSALRSAYLAGLVAGCTCTEPHDSCNRCERFVASHPPNDTTASALELRGVARRYARTWALRGVDLAVEAGESVALAGPNGSGKTTLLRVAATLARPTRGHGTVYGHDLVRDAADVRRHVALLAHRTGLYEDLSARQNLAFAARMLGKPAASAHTGALLERVGLSEHAERGVRGFSSGMRRRLALARILLAPPALLLLDEPFASFDAEGLEVLEAVISDVRERGGTVVIATHDLGRAGRVTERTVRLERGRVAADAPREVAPRAREAAQQRVGTW